MGGGWLPEATYSTSVSVLSTNGPVTEGEQYHLPQGSNTVFVHAFALLVMTTPGIESNIALSLLIIEKSSLVVLVTQ